MRRLLDGLMTSGAYSKALMSIEGEGDEDQGGSGGEAAAKPAEGSQQQAAAGDTGEGDADGGEDGEPAQEKPHWAERRLGRITAQLRAKEEENRLLKERLSPAKPAGDADQQQQRPAVTDEEIDRRANERARQIAAQNEFNRASAKTVDEGRVAFKDFDTVMARFNGLGGLIAMEQDTGFLSAALATDNPSKVLYDLGKDLAEAERISSLSPQRMAVEMDRLARARPKPKQSQAPAPGQHRVDGRVLAEGLADELPPDEWMRRRNAQVKEGGRRRIGG